MLMCELATIPIAVVAVERTPHRAYFSMAPLDITADGPSLGVCQRVFWYDYRDLLPSIADRTVVTAGSRFRNLLRDSGLDDLPPVYDILAVFGEPTLEQACSRHGIELRIDRHEVSTGPIEAIAALTALGGRLFTGVAI